MEIQELPGLISDTEMDNDKKAFLFLTGAVAIVEELKRQEIIFGVTTAELDVVKSDLYFKIPLEAAKSVDSRNSYITKHSDVKDLTFKLETLKSEISYLKRLLKVVEDAHVFNRQKAELLRKY
jgi:hypothetical protein